MSGFLKSGKENLETFLLKNEIKELCEGGGT
jgi:hypothetical protein